MNGQMTTLSDVVKNVLHIKRIIIVSLALIVNRKYFSKTKLFSLTGNTS